MDPERAEVDAAIEVVGREADGAGDGDGKEDDLFLENGADEAKWLQQRAEDRHARMGPLVAAERNAACSHQL
jgi:hypothetical protein